MLPDGIQIRSSLLLPSYVSHLQETQKQQGQADPQYFKPSGDSNIESDIEDERDNHDNCYIINDTQFNTSRSNFNPSENTNKLYSTYSNSNFKVNPTTSNDLNPIQEITPYSLLFEKSTSPPLSSINNNLSDKKTNDMNTNMNLHKQQFTPAFNLKQFQDGTQSKPSGGSTRVPSNHSSSVAVRQIINDYHEQLQAQERQYEYDQFQRQLSRNNSIADCSSKFNLSILRQSSPGRFYQSSRSHRIDSQSSISKEQQTSYAQKMYEYDKLYKEKRGELAEELSKKDLEKCTFAPKTNNNGPKRSLTEFIESQEKFLENAQSKRQLSIEAKEKNIIDSMQAAPSICEKTNMYLKKHSLHNTHTNNKNTEDDQHEPAWHRLYSVSQSQDGGRYHRNKHWQEQHKKIDPQTTFKPQILDYSQKLIRDNKVDVILYADAKRRQHTSNSMHCSNSVNKNSPRKSQSPSKSGISMNSSVLPQSNQMLAQRFIKEYQYAVSQAGIQDQNCLQLWNVFDLLLQLGFIQNKGYGRVINNITLNGGKIAEDQIQLVFLLWSLLLTSEKSTNNTNNIINQSISPDNLLTFLLTIQNLPSNLKVSQNNPFELQPQTFETLPTARSIDNADKLKRDESYLQTILVNRDKDLNTFNNNSINYHTITLFANNTTQQSAQKYRKSSMPSVSSIPLLSSSSKKLNTIENISISKRSYSGNSPQKGMDSNNFKVSSRIKTEQQSTLQTQYQEEQEFLQEQLQKKELWEYLKRISKEFKREKLNIGQLDDLRHQWRLSSNDKYDIKRAFQGLQRNRVFFEQESKLSKEQYDFQGKHDTIASVGNTENSPNGKQSARQSKGQLSARTEELAEKRRTKVLEITSSLLANQEISMNSLSTNGNNIISHEQLMLLEKLAFERSLSQKRAVREQECMVECSFNPEILKVSRDGSPQRGLVRTQQLFSQAVGRHQKRDRTTEEVEFEKAASQCTFQPSSQREMKPKHNHHQQSQQLLRQHSQITSESFDKSVIRMKKAHQERQISAIIKNTRCDRKKANEIFNNTLKQTQAKQLQFIQQTISKPPIPVYHHGNTLHTSQPISNNSQNQTLFGIPSMHTMHSVSRSELGEQENNCPQKYQNNIYQDMYSQSMAQKLIPQNNVSSMPSSQQKIVETTNKKSFVEMALERMANNKTAQQQQQQQLKQQPQQQILQTGSSSQLIPTVSSQAELSSSIIGENERVPLLFVDVNLGLGKSDRIVVYEGDKSDTLAKKFAMIHHLDAAMEMKFKLLLDTQIEGLLSKIDEEEILSCESESINHSGINLHVLHSNKRLNSVKL